MNLTPEILAQVRELAAVPGQTPTSIALACGIRPLDFHAQLALEDSELYREYHAGLLLSRIQHGQKVQHLANAGSGPAQTLQHRMHTDQRVREVQEFYNLPPEL